MSKHLSSVPESTTHIESGYGEFRFLKQFGKAYLLWNGQRWTHPVKPYENVKTMAEVKVTGLPDAGEEPEEYKDYAGFNNLSVDPQPGDTLFELWRCWGESGMKRVEKTVFVGREYGRDFDEAVRRHIKKIGEVDVFYHHGGWYDSFYQSKDAAPKDFMPELTKERAENYEVPYS